MIKRPSIRTRLLVWTTLVTTVIMIGAGCFLFQSLRASLYEQFDRVLNEAATVIMIEVEVKDSKIYHEWKESLEKKTLKAGDALIQVWDYHTDETVRSTLLGNHNLEKNHGALGERVFYNLDLPDGRKGRAVGILTLPVIEEQTGNEGYLPEDHPQIFVWAEDTADLQRLLNHTRNALVIAGATGLLLIWSAIFIVISLSSRAMQTVVDEVRSRDGSEVGQPLSLPDNLPSEIAIIAERFNSLLKKIDSSRERDRDFFMNVAHEVRTPLAGIRAIIEQALRKPREIADYQVRMRNALEEIEGLNRLVNRLMKFGRLRQQGEDLDLQKVDLHEMSECLWQVFSGRAAERSLTSEWHFSQDATLVSDGELVKIVLTNLLENALSYAPRNSVIHLRTERNSKSLHFFITNKAPWKDDEEPDLDLFFDHFYRRDSSRNFKGNHAGIGLSFSREILEVLGGTITVSRKPEGSVTFDAAFPLLPAPSH